MLRNSIVILVLALMVAFVACQKDEATYYDSSVHAIAVSLRNKLLILRQL